jgi:DNA polymerase-3 subunit epsilon
MRRYRETRMTDQGQATEQARLIMQQNPLILDTETTGLGGDAEICEIAVIDARGRILVDQLIKPFNPIPANASAIHSITNDDVAEAPHFGDVWPQLTTILLEQTVVIYNSAYDLRLLRQSGMAVGIDLMGALQSITRNTFCAMKLYAQYHGERDGNRPSYKWQRLAAAGQQCGITLPPDLHRARADTELTLKVMRHMAN